MQTLFTDVRNNRVLFVVVLSTVALTWSMSSTGVAEARQHFATDNMLFYEDTADNPFGEGAAGDPDEGDSKMATPKVSENEIEGPVGHGSRAGIRGYLKAVWSRFSARVALLIRGVDR